MLTSVYNKSHGYPPPVMPSLTASIFLCALQTVFDVISQKIGCLFTFPSELFYMVPILKIVGHKRGNNKRVMLLAHEDKFIYLNLRLVSEKTVFHKHNHCLNFVIFNTFNQCPQSFTLVNAESA